MGIALKHIVAGAGGGEQHDIARLRGGVSGSNGLRQGVAKLVRHVVRGEFGGDFGRILSNQEHGTGFVLQHGGERGEVLPFALPACDKHDFFRQPCDGGNGCAHVGAFAVVNVHNAVFCADFFYAVGQAFEGLDVAHQFAARDADGFA